MTDEQIKKLAEECSLYYQCRPSNKGYELSNRLTIESYALMTLKWLSERYCIVPKEQVKDTYNNFADKLTDRFHLTAQERAIAHASIASALVHIFGKDMFEEEGK